MPGKVARAAGQCDGVHRSLEGPLPGLHERQPGVQAGLEPDGRRRETVEQTGVGVPPRHRLDEQGVPILVLEKRGEPSVGLRTQKQRPRRSMIRLLDERRPEVAAEPARLVTEVGQAQPDPARRRAEREQDGA